MAPFGHLRVLMRRLSGAVKNRGVIHYFDSSCNWDCSHRQNEDSHCHNGKWQMRTSETFNVTIDVPDLRDHWNDISYDRAPMG